MRSQPKLSVLAAMLLGGATLPGGVTLLGACSPRAAGEGGAPVASSTGAVGTSGSGNAATTSDPATAATAATTAATPSPAEPAPAPPEPLEPPFGPLVAGTFYPGEPRELGESVDRYLAEADGLPQSRSLTLPEPLLGMMLPHAGYRYSGLAAAVGYRLLRGRQVGLVVLLAPSHRVRAPHAATLDRQAYATPLGEVAIARDLARQLISGSSVVRGDMRLFAEEHSLEVQLPFLQRVLPGVPVLPLVLGSAEPGLCTELARALHRLLGQRTDVLVLASSDMSHYLPYAQGNEIDRQTLELVLGLDPAALQQALASDRAQLCGGAPVVTLIELLALRGGGQAKLLFHNNSGDTAGDKERVVGYGVVAFGGGGAPAAATAAATGSGGGAVLPTAAAAAGEESYGLSSEEKGLLLQLARSTVESYVTRRQLPPFSAPSGRLSRPGAAFVTLKKHGELRGCIGHTEPHMALWKCVQSVAVSAATEDPRFPAVTPDELAELHYEVSVLTPLQPLPDPLHVRVGTDGLVVSWRGRRGLLLPQVPGELGWSKEEFLAHTCRKAGLPLDCWQLGASFQKFQALVFP
ncbi:MAG: AmmeMemoRadiSam system protein B [Deltaproteobacteria bacterium]|nr:AmmeMemoRadiSam system protein B [Deltaproteobacteria bacterium]